MTTKYLDVSNRPSSTEEAINIIFQSIQTYTNWKYAGNKKYNICGEDYFIISKIISDNNLTEFTAIDSGAGDNSWSYTVANYLTANHPSVTFALYSLNGERCDSKTIKIGNGSIHNLCSFMIENIDRQFKLSSIDLLNKVDLIVSNMVSCHLIDPLGTLLQYTKLIKPSTGMILTDSFMFSYIDKNKQTIYSLDEKFVTPKLFNILSQSNLEFLTCPNKKYKDYAYIAIRKPNDEVKIPVKYYTPETVSIQGNNVAFKELVDGINEAFGSNFSYKTAFSGTQGRVIFNLIKQFNVFQSTHEQENFSYTEDEIFHTNYQENFTGSKDLYDFFDENTDFRGYCHSPEYCAIDAEL